MPKNNDKSSFSSPAGERPATTPTSGTQSRYQTAKEGWSDQVTFPASMGLRRTSNDIEEINRVNEAFRKADAEAQAYKRE